MIKMRSLSLKANMKGPTPIYVCYVSICVFNYKINRCFEKQKRRRHTVPGEEMVFTQSLFVSIPELSSVYSRMVISVFAECGGIFKPT